MKGIDDVELHHVDIDPRVPEIPTPVSLTVIVAVFAVASLIKTRRDPNAKAHAGSLRAHGPRQADAGQDQPTGG